MIKSILSTKKSYLILGFLAIFCVFFFSGITATESAGISDRLLQLLKKEYKPIKPLLPPDVKIMPDYKPGVGPVIGNVSQAQGKAYVVHEGLKAAFPLPKGSPLFTNDTLVTGDRSRLSVSLNDKSVFTLAANSKLAIDESIYNPKKNERKSKLSLLFGRARFIVSKIAGKPSFQVKTPTAVCGVRGSDFALAVAPEAIKLSSTQSFFSKIGLVTEAHAQMPGMMTIVVTGPGTNVGFAGVMGPAMGVGPTSVTAAVAGGAAMSPIGITAAAAAGALGSIGPGLASLGMPPE